MSDKELLELAAKAAGIKVHGLADKFVAQHDYGPDGLCVANDRGGDSLWNPLTDDGDAFRLMVKLNLNLYVDCAFENVQARMVYVENNVSYDPNYRSIKQDSVTDPLTTARRVIVELAAKLGKEMK